VGIFIRVLLGGAENIANLPAGPRPSVNVMPQKGEKFPSGCGICTFGSPSFLSVNGRPQKTRSYELDAANGFCDYFGGEVTLSGLNTARG
jgi:hypothetical protein